MYKDRFPIYLEGFNLEHDNNDLKIRSIINYFIQLYDKTSGYRCNKNTIEILTIIPEMVYLYNNQSMYDGTFFTIFGKGLYISEVKNILNNYPSRISGFKNPCNSDLLDHNLALTKIRDEYKLMYKFSSEEEKLLTSIFEHLAGYDYNYLYQELLNSKMFQENNKAVSVIRNSKSNIIRSYGNINILDKNKVQEYIKNIDTNTMIGKFITEYDFSGILYESIYNKESTQNNVNKLCKKLGE